VTLENVALVRQGREVVVRVAEEQAGERVFRLLRAGVCGTDLQICRGLRSDVAQILGHEGVAQPVAPRGGGQTFVAFNPVDAREQDRILGHSYDGIFQRYFMPRPFADPETVPVSAALVADLGPLIEPLAAVLYGWELVQATCDVSSAVVLGAGTTAALALLVGELRGVGMTLVHPRASRLAFLENVLPLRRTRFLAEPEPGAGRVDAAFVCVPRDGAMRALSSALSLVRPGGVIDLLGGFTGGDHHPDLGAIDLGAVRRANVCGTPRPGRSFSAPAWPVRVTGHRGTSMAHLRDAHQLLVSHPRLFAAVVSHVLSWEAAAAFLSAVCRGDAGAAPLGERLKVVIDPTLSGREARPPDMRTSLAGAAVL
jgi:threonine dehydrogenase-like Zn-dependent dehydrogenase